MTDSDNRRSEAMPIDGDAVLRVGGDHYEDGVRVIERATVVEVSIRGHRIMSDIDHDVARRMAAAGQWTDAQFVEQVQRLVGSMPAGQCLRSWTPRTCRSSATSEAARWRSPIDHVCWLPRWRPHVCVCVRCGWWGQVAGRGVRGRVDPLDALLDWMARHG